MASRFNTAQSDSNNNDQSWKARGFLNVLLPRANGSEGKLGAIALKASDADMVKLCEWLEANEANLTKLVSRIKIVYRSAEKAEGSGFVLD